ncbi:hypothetical protein HK104_008963 [Borealophlyctis nickersoniae]|nr:hypothetical protein HK104_008963 [Borealophlyctis nickersoniae]
MERQIILALEGSAFVISLANAVYSYWHYAKNRKLRSNQETAVAQTLCLVSSVLAWLSKDWDHKVLKPGDEGKLVSAMLVFFTLGWALELLVVLRYTRAIRNCLLYRPIWNQIIKGITLLVFLVTVFCLIMGIIRTKPGVAGLDVYHRYVGMIWGGYTLFLSIGIAGVVAAMVFKTWRDMYTAASKNVAVGDTTTTRIKELDRIKKFVIVGNILVMAVVLAAGVFYATRPPEDELSESMSKIRSDEKAHFWNVCQCN